MPNPLDRCGSCRQPVYAEDNVAGGCDCSDRDFRVLLAQQKQRNNGGNAVLAEVQQTSSLSELDPSFLMSAAGRSELEGAMQLSGSPVRGRTQHVAFIDDDVEAEVDRLREIARDMPEVTSGEETDLDLDGDWTGTWANQGRHSARVASLAAGMDNVDLGAMWLQGTGIPFDRSQLEASGSDGFEFGLDEMVVQDGPRGGGGGGGRFRVDAGAPPRIPFNRGLVNDQGPMREAARVRGYAVLRETGPGAYQRPAAVPPVEAYDPSPARTAPMSAMQQARAIQASKSKGPSVYDLIRSNRAGK